MEYKWIALSNTTIGSLMASLDGTIVLISLPAIFRGIQIDPLNSFEYLLWLLFGYSVATSTLLVTFGRISDMFGRVKLYNLGFAIFTGGSLLAYLTPNTGDLGALELIVFRIVQGVGGAFLFANGAAIITDAFPENERGQALGINMVSILAGSLIGLIMGGVLATYNWRYIFLVSVPVGIAGTIWSYMRLEERGKIDRNQKLDVWGNATFGVGLTLILLAVSYGLEPYGSSPMGWGNPWVAGALLAGCALLAAFPFIESRIKYPMFNLGLFKIQAFSAGNVANLLSSVGRGGVQIMLIILLQGIWLPLHGYSFESTPFWSGIYITPMLLGFVVMGPLSGRLSDRHGARGLATLGMVITGVTFLLLSTLPYNFQFWEFALILFAMGIGGGLFASPNTVAIMNSVPPEHRGVASGMRATLQNTGQTVSIAIFFTIVLSTLAGNLPGALSSAAMNAGAPQLAQAFNQIPPTGAVFAAFLGYNPIGSILSSPQLAPLLQAHPLSAQVQSYLTGTTFFPTAIAPPFMTALQEAFYIGVAISAVAALASAMRGTKATARSPYIVRMEKDLSEQKTPVEPKPALESETKAAEKSSE